jgi:hypothetical protein
LGSAFVLAALLGALYVAGASANLTGSTFGGGDGNLACNDSGISGGGANDWNTSCAPAGGINIGYDDPSGNNDNSLGQGSKEDDPNITVVAGSIPPNKSDLTRFYEASESVGGNVFLYLAWERTNVLGSANMDFEVNKNGTAGFDGSFVGKITLNRTNGDLLVTYDFDNGGSRPTIGLLRWLAVGGTNPYDSSKTNVAADCFSANALPCWGDKHVLGPALAEAAINTSPVVDGLGNGTNACPGSPATCPGLTFGEAAINLTAAGVTTTSSCDFGSATTFLRSRSSTSFTSEMKDLVAPIATPINPCSSITIIKHTLNAAGSRAGDSKVFNYTATGTGLSAFALADATGSDVTCTGSNTCNKKVFTGLGPGSYSVSETLPVAGYALTDLTCSKSGTGTSVTPDGSSSSASSASITLGFGGSVTCTFTNQQQTGAIRVRKVSAKSDANGPIPLNGASFTYALVTNGQAGTATAFPNPSGNDGYTCVAGLAFGTYRIAESAPPSGFNQDSSTQDVTVSSSGTCTSGYTSAANNFVDTPLTDLHVHVQSEASTGGTQSNVTCTKTVNNVTTNIGNSPQPTSGNADPVDLYADGAAGHGGALTPGTYNCTIVIDP